MNGGFDSGDDGWTVTSDSAQDIVFWTQPAGGCYLGAARGSGCLNLTALANSHITASQCVAVRGNAIDASVLIFPFVTAGPAGAQLTAFAGPDCAGSDLGTITLMPSGPVAVGNWTSYESAGTPLPSLSRSVLFELVVADGANNSTGDYLFDDAQLTSLSIFADGFDVP